MHFQDFLDLCQARQSVRHFANTPIAPETVEQLIQAAILSPSVENTQPWRFTAVYDPAIKRQLAEASCYGDLIGDTAVFIVVSCDTRAKPTSKSTLWNPRELEYSCATAMQTLLLGATAMGIASCWVSLHRGVVHELLALPMYEVIIGGIMLGQFLPDAAQGAVHHERTPLSHILRFLPPLSHEPPADHPVPGRGRG